MSAYFITGTGTDIGKTWLTCAVLRHWRAAGLRPMAYKPLISGFDAALAKTSDAGQILQALGREVNAAALDEIAPWRFSAPLSPDMAAACEERTIDFDALAGFTRRICRLGESRGSTDASLTLIEGVGGVMAPLDECHTVRDWIVASGLPCVLVAGSYLGSLSHALTAFEALRKVGAGVTAIVVNESPGSAVALADTVASLQSHVGGVRLVAIERDAPQTGIAELAACLG